MRILSIDTNFSDYKKVVLKVSMPNCSFKCCTDLDLPKSTCANYPMHGFGVEMKGSSDVLSYYDPSIHNGILLGGLEPFDSFKDMREILKAFVCKYPNDDIVIYSGYKYIEIQERVIDLLSDLYVVGDNTVFIKFGRYMPNKPSYQNEQLGVELASDNQYVKTYILSDLFM